MTLGVSTATPVAHVVAGRVVEGADVAYEGGGGGPGFVTPRLDLDALVVARTQPGPAFDLPIGEVVDFLVAVGERLAAERNPWVDEARDLMQRVTPLEPHVLAHEFATLPGFFERATLDFQLEQELGAAADGGWRTVVEPSGRRSAVRAFPPRLVHVLAGNGAGVAAMSIVRAALTRGLHLLKLPANDPFTATAILRTMADVDADHPTLRSFSAAYWRGGDTRIEGALYRAQFFDKIVVWGGDEAVRNALRYAGPGFDVVAFDPKISISFVGREAFVSDDTLAAVADQAATDVTVLDQNACVASRFQFVEGSVDDVDRYCTLLAERLPLRRDLASAVGPRPPSDIVEEVEVLAQLAPTYAVFGSADGRGLVIRSEEPVDFHPSGRTVNVVAVDDLADAVRYATVATQTVGMYPAERKATLRDALAGCGVQRVVTLGEAIAGGPGLPHDAMYPLHRLVRWVVDEDVTDDGA